MFIYCTVFVIVVNYYHFPSKCKMGGIKELSRIKVSGISKQKRKGHCLRSRPNYAQYVHNKMDVKVRCN